MRKLGRVIEHDERSRAFAFEAKAVPRTVIWHHEAPVLDQGELGSCTGNALAQWLNVSTNMVARQPNDFLAEVDAIGLYSTATRLDSVHGHYPPEDTGSSGLAVCKAGRKLGWLTAYRWTFSWNSFLMAMQHSAVIVGTAWYENMFEPTRDGFLTPTGDLAGGHEYLVLGVDMEQQFVTILNSWGPNWGINGRARVRFTDFRALLADHGDVTVPIL